jgi:AraC family transcriptional activator of tynA and feaB
MIYSTQDVHPRERLSYWREVATRGYVEHDSRPLDRANFRGKVKISSLPGVGLAAFDAEAHAVLRSERNAGHEDTGDLLLSALFSGEVSLTQDGRESVLNGPSLYLVDPVRPFDLVLRERCVHVIAKIPRTLLEARIGHTGDLTGRGIGVSQGVGTLVMGMLQLLSNEAETLDDMAGLKVAEQLLDLSALTLVKERESGPALSSPRAVALLRLKATIERLLIEHNLKPDRIAAETGISVRYANALLAEENWSIERYVNERRLERCRAALEDPGQDHRNIGEIAFKWGFSDLSHFGRRFKQRYGLTPTEYRIECRRNAVGAVQPLPRAIIRELT